MNNEKRWRQRFENFEKSYNLFLRRDEDYRKDNKSEAFQMSLIQSYEILIELSWKLMKDYLENEGIDCGHPPKNIIRHAFKAEIIKNPEGWMKAIEKRNKTSHIYNPKILEEVIDFVDKKFLFLARDLYDFFKKEAKKR